MASNRGRSSRNGAKSGTIAQASAAADLHDSIRELRVLIAEDHDFQRKTLVRLIQSLGIRDVAEARDGFEALSLLSGAYADVDLILCDLDMPKMDGMEFMRHLGSGGSRAAMIITSAHDRTVMNSVEIMAQAYGIRLLGVIEKPVSRHSVVGMLKSAGAEGMYKGTSTVVLPHRFELDDILAGIERNQIEPFYQAKAELASGRIVGAEALARWRHPEYGLVAPAAFIPILETAGAIDTLTFSMLSQAAGACRRWREQGLDLSVSVNLSLASLSDITLADRISQRVTDSGLGAPNLILEITETTAMTGIAPALENLARLRLRGFGLSIDDFGTGFSSIQQLGRVAFTELKIDREFVSRMTEKRESRAIVQASIDMARRLDIEVVAEGVESPAEWNALLEAGCGQAQGYFISKPIDDQAFVKLCSNSAT